MKKKNLASKCRTWGKGSEAYVNRLQMSASFSRCVVVCGEVLDKLFEANRFRVPSVTGIFRLYWQVSDGVVSNQYYGRLLLNVPWVPLPQPNSGMGAGSANEPLTKNNHGDWLERKTKTVDVNSGILGGSQCIYVNSSLSGRRSVVPRFEAQWRMRDEEEETGKASQVGGNRWLVAGTSDPLLRKRAALWCFHITDELEHD